MNNWVQIGKLISTLRQERSYTQADLAQKLGTTQSVVARIEQGEQNLSTETLTKISDVFERSLIEVSKGLLNINVEGGHKLHGEIVTKTSKNGAMGLLAACLLNKGKTILKNVPKIEEVHRMVEVFQSIGVNVKWDKNDP